MPGGPIPAGDITQLIDDKVALTAGERAYVLKDHKVYVSRVVDGNELELLGVISATQPTLAIDVDS